MFELPPTRLTTVDAMHPTPEERAAIDELKRRLLGDASLPPTPVDYDIVNDEVLHLRYLRANDLNVKKAVRMLVKSAQWRNRFRPDALRSHTDWISKQLRTGKNYISGTDGEQHPVLMMRLGRDTDNSTVEEKLMFAVYKLETVARVFGRASRVIMLVDLTGFNWRWLQPSRLKLSRQLLHVLQAHFPESLHRMFFFNYPKVFYGFFKFIKPFLKRTTAEKLEFVDKKHVRETMARYFDAAALEADFGGDRPFQFDADSYMRWLGEIEPALTERVLHKLTLDMDDDAEQLPSQAEEAEGDGDGDGEAEGDGYGDAGAGLLADSDEEAAGAGDEAGAPKLRADSTFDHDEFVDASDEI